MEISATIVTEPARFEMGTSTGQKLSAMNGRKEVLSQHLVQGPMKTRKHLRLDHWCST
jgi:hypothetical protein